MSIKQRIAGFIASGATPAQAARAVGVSDGYVSQLMNADAEFKEILAVKAAQRVEVQTKTNDLYEDVEKQILDEMKAKISTSDMRELTNALQAVAKSNPRRVALGGERGGHGVQTVVQLNLPAFLADAVSVKMNARNEVVEIGGQSMLPLTAREIHSKIRDIEVVKEVDYVTGTKQPDESTGGSPRQAQSVPLNQLAGAAGVPSDF